MNEEDIADHFIEWVKLEMARQGIGLREFTQKVANHGSDVERSSTWVYRYFKTSGSRQKPKLEMMVKFANVLGYDLQMFAVNQSEKEITHAIN